jgi:hypothetical protein
MAGLGVVGANLVEQAWQRRCIAGVVCDLNGPDSQGPSINSKVCLAPLTAVVRIMFLRFHSPSPNILMPVLSTSKCNPDVVLFAVIVTVRCFCRRLTVLKSEISPSSPLAAARFTPCPLSAAAPS